jgi:hypothetical protein
MYIARAKPFVINQLNPSITTTTKTFSRIFLICWGSGDFARDIFSTREKSFVAFIAAVRIDLAKRSYVLDDAASMGAMRAIAGTLRTGFIFAT